eukprot:scaffold208924_cov30-Tisochrysis_lutea.AAC.3
MSAFTPPPPHTMTTTVLPANGAIAWRCFSEYSSASAAPHAGSTRTRWSSSREAHADTAS